MQAAADECALVHWMPAAAPDAANANRFKHSQAPAKWPDRVSSSNAATPAQAAASGSRSAQQQT